MAKKTNVPVVHSNEEEIYHHVLSLLYQRHGIDFTNYKPSTIHRRIERRMSMRKLNKLSEYFKLLSGNSTELKFLFSDLLIPVTSFFRDPQTCEILSNSVFPKLIKNRPANEPIRVWVAGCATGEEAYSFGICLHEFLHKKYPDQKVQIFATDVSEICIEKARKAVYTTQSIKSVSPLRLKKYFEKTEGGYKIGKVIREMCVFAVHNFLLDPPFAHMDLVSCRNVLIYMNTKLQNKALATFHYALKESGYLLLGKSETTLTVPELFSTVSSHDKIYSRKPANASILRFTKNRETVVHSRNIAAWPQEGIHSFNRRAEHLLLSNYIPKGVIVNGHNTVVQFFGDSSNYILPPHGKASLSILKMAREELSFELRNTLNDARKTRKKATSQNIPFKEKKRDGILTIEVLPLGDIPEEHFLVLFHFKASGISVEPRKKVTANTKDSSSYLQIKQLEKELLKTREDMQSMSEEQDAANEELQSANEELLSSTEELQSMNEELEASQEELQASNQELILANRELSEHQQQLKEANLKLEEFARELENKVEERTRELQLKNEELKGSEQRYHKMVDEVRDYAIILLNKNGIIENWNKGAEKIKGYRSDEILGKNFRIFYTNEDRERKQPEKLIQIASDTGRAMDEGWRVRKDGTRFWGSITITALHDDNNEVIGFSKVTRDLTERKIAEENKQRYLENMEVKNAELMKTNAELERFSYLASHDLQEPLRKILTFSNRLQEKYPELPGDMKTYLDKIDGASARMTTLIKDLLNYSRLSNPEVEFEMTDLNEIITHVLSDFDLLAEQKKAKIKVKLLPEIEAIEIQMNQLFHNLIGNALKFTKEDILPVIHISARMLHQKDIKKYSSLLPDLSYVEIIVKDNGIGFDPNYSQQIFSLFKRLHERNKFQGTGIGLSLSKKIVDIHHGIIFAESNENEGAAFHIILPVLQPVAEANLNPEK